MNELSDSSPYTTLGPGQIRLVSIFFGSGSDELLLCLRIVKLEETTGSYEALSYAWGQKNPSERIGCNYSQTDTVEVSAGDTRRIDVYPYEATHCVKVTPNLKEALLQLRVVDDFRTLWIDSICINQEDSQEKSEQVCLMAEIYARAENVLVWLGVEDDITASAISCLESLARLRNVSFDELTLEEIDASIGFRPWNSNKNDRTYIPHDHWRSFKRLLCERPWFRRVWVYQEIAMAHRATVICGIHAIDWDILYTACNTIHALNIHTGQRGTPRDASTIVAHILSMGHRREAILRLRGRQETELQGPATIYPNFEALLCEFRSLEATDPRDKVYALLAVTLIDETLPKPDYSLSVRQVYTSIARNLLGADGYHNLRCLSYVQKTNEIYELPSWVPDWTRQFAMHLIAESNDKFQATGNLQAPVISYPDSIDNDHRRALLTIRGIRILTIKALDLSSATFSPDKRMHAAMINAFPDPYPTTNQTYLEAYPGSVNPMVPGEYGPAPERRFGTFWEHIRAFEGQANPTKTSDQSERYTQDQLDAKLNDIFVLGMVSDGIAYQRVFFISWTGFMGLAPKGTLPNDEVVLFFGAHVPFIIRASKDGGWKLIGECYVYGIMFGEAMEGLDMEKSEDFVLT